MQDGWKIMRFLSFVLTILCCLLVGCSIFSSKKIPSSGYAITAHGPQTYVISYDGIGYFSVAQVDHYLLMRAAMLAKENNYPYFTVAEVPTENIPFPQHHEKLRYCKAVLVHFLSRPILNREVFSAEQVLGIPP